jgi:hypothetical protein
MACQIAFRAINTVHSTSSTMAKHAAGRRKASNGSSSLSAARLRSLETEMEQNRRDLALQFRRIAQIQVDIDTIKRAVLKMKLPGD